MKKLLSGIVALALLAASFAFLVPAPVTAATTWNTTGNYVLNMEYLGSYHPHDMTLVQNNMGMLSGNGGSPSVAPVYTWALTSGSVVGSTIDFVANYTATADAVTPQTVLTVSGVIALDGTMSGTWTDNYQGGTRAGTWATTTGAATVISLNAEDFGVVSYDTGTTGILKGYTAGFGLANATLAGATAVTVQLVAGTTVLQTNTADMTAFNAMITGAQFSSPFDVSGTFNYGLDGYWTNTREVQYGQSTPATSVVATVTLADGTVVTATNNIMVGDATTIYPPANTAPVLSAVPMEATIPELALYGFDADAVDTDMPMQPLTFTLVGAPTGAMISATTGIFSWIPTEAQGPGVYTFTVMVSDGTLSDSAPITLTVTEVTPVVTGPVTKDDCKNGGWKTFTAPTFKNQGQCVSMMAR